MNLKAHHCLDDQENEETNWERKCVCVGEGGGGGVGLVGIELQGVHVNTEGNI